MKNELLLLTADDVDAVLSDADVSALSAVRGAYIAHALGHTSVPPSSFIYLPAAVHNRIIALPSYVDDQEPVMGIKWIASFPGNVKLGMDRASAIVILNSPETGKPEVILEGSKISAVRTAASAAIAAQNLALVDKPITVSLIGCGPINFTIVRFLRVVFGQIDCVCVYDKSLERAMAFAKSCRKHYNIPQTEVADDMITALSFSRLISFATTAAAPHVQDLSMCLPGTVILHVSLRDLSPEVILNADNVVDDRDHVCRAQTSLHLAECTSGDRTFIRATLPEILVGQAVARISPYLPIIFSPFGLGILDLAVASLVSKRARKQGKGMSIPFFSTSFCETMRIDADAPA